tara:strand:+ start:426 stop:665 length:240 start_codon:yes stop_codon:yes gene_type:complete
MKKTISYWSPHISKVATIKAVYNSAISLNYFSKEDFIRKFYQFRNLNANKKNSYVYNAKKFIKRFTLLSHYNELKKLIV